MSRDAIRSVENAVLMAFNGTVPEGLVLRTDNGHQYISHEFRNAMRHQLPLVGHSLITMNVGLIHPLIIFLQGNSGGSSWMIRHSGKDSGRKKLS